MRIVVSFLIIFFLFAGCSGQEKKKEIHNADFNWTITIPEGFTNVSAEDWAKMQGKGQDAIEKTYGQEIVNQSKTIFVFKSGPTNYFDSNYQPFDESVDGDYLTACAAVTKVLYETFATQIPGAKIDTVRSSEKIDGLEFVKYHMKLELPNKIVMHNWMYSRLFVKKEFTVNIMYVDEAKGKQMLEAWTASKFGNK